jgi:hypothetical protein
MTWTSWAKLGLGAGEGAQLGPSMHVKVVRYQHDGLAGQLAAGGDEQVRYSDQVKALVPRLR